MSANEQKLEEKPRPAEEVTISILGQSFWNKGNVNLTSPEVRIATYISDDDWVAKKEYDTTTKIDKVTEEEHDTITKIDKVYRHDEAISTLSLAKTYPYSRGEPFSEEGPSQLKPTTPNFKRALIRYEFDLGLIKKSKEKQLCKYEILRASATSVEAERIYSGTLESKKSELRKIISDNTKSTRDNFYTISQLAQELEYLNCAIDCVRGHHATCESKVTALKAEIQKIELVLTKMEYPLNNACGNDILQQLYKDIIEIVQRSDERKLAEKFMDSIEEDQIAQQKEKKSSHQVEVDQLLKENEKLNKESTKLKDTSNNQYLGTLFKKNACQKTEAAGRAAQSHPHNLEASIIVFGM